MVGMKQQRPSLFYTKESGNAKSGSKNGCTIQTPSKERKEQTVPELQNHNPYQPPKQSHASNTESHQHSC